MIARFGTFEDALAQRYQFEQELGRGAMGTVYRAKDLRLGRAVAIKMLHPALTNELGVGRFESEIRIAARLHHQNIISVHESGEVEGRLFYVMDYLGGETLRDRLKRDKQLSVDDAIRITEQVAAGLQHAHDNGVVHRDIKPENIILAEGQARIVDFGLARALDDVDAQRLTASGLSVGTPHYLSPEQASAEREIGPAADQYGLACVLYEMLVGEPPFTGPTASAVAMRHISETPPPLKARRKSAPGGVEAAVMRALEKVPADRFASMKMFIRALEPGALLPSPVAGGGKNVRVHARRMAALLGLVLAFVAAMTFAREPATASLGDGVRWLTNRPLDPKRFLILPHLASAVASDPAIDGLVRDAFARWSDISLVGASELAGALGPASDRIPTDRALKAARALQAGTVVAVEVTPRPTGRHLRIELTDTRASASTQAREARLPAGGDTEGIIASLVYSLLFTGDEATRSADAAMGTRSREAFTLYLRGMQETRRWNLSGADSAFADAIELDKDFPQALLGLAQVRAWARDDSPDVLSLLTRASDAPRQSSARHARHVAALMHLRLSRHQDACAQYAPLTREDARDFAAWYGLGECNRLDKTVVPATLSPSGRHFRGSRNRAILAVRRAFDLMPAIDSCCVRRADEVLRRPLIVDNMRLLTGRGLAPDSTMYAAYPELLGDTIAYIPFPLAQTNRQPPRTHALALDRQRALFHQIASSRVRMFPQSADALEELAEALELRGATSAIDTIRRARRFTKNPQQALRLAAIETWLGLKTAIPDQKEGLGRARRLGDSLLAHASPRSPADHDILASLAALVGDATGAARLSERGLVEVHGDIQVTDDVRTHAGAFMAYAALGGPLDSLRNAETRLRAAIDNGVVPQHQHSARQTLIGIPASLAYPTYSSERFGDLDSQMNDLIAAEQAHARGDRGAVRRILEATSAGRIRMRAVDLSLDALFPEAWLLAAIGDTVGAQRTIAPTLDGLRHVTVKQLMTVPNAGALVRAMSLHAELLSRTKQREKARQWARAVVTLTDTANARARENRKAVFILAR